MKKTAKENYVILEEESKNFDQLLLSLRQQEKEFANENLVINLLDHEGLSSKEILELKPFSNRHRSNKKSLVIVNDSVSIDEIPEDLMVVPTLLEAEDLIQMEEIERDLGF